MRVYFDTGIFIDYLSARGSGIRAAGALHAATAIAFDAELIVSTDEGLLELDGVLVYTRGFRVLCRDTDSAYQAL